MTKIQKIILIFLCIFTVIIISIGFLLLGQKSASDNNASKNVVSSSIANSNLASKKNSQPISTANRQDISSTSAKISSNPIQSENSKSSSASISVTSSTPIKTINNSDPNLSQYNIITIPKINITIDNPIEDKTYLIEGNTATFLGKGIINLYSVVINNQGSYLAETATKYNAENKLYLIDQNFTNKKDVSLNLEQNFAGVRQINSSNFEIDVISTTNRAQELITYNLNLNKFLLGQDYINKKN